MRDRQFLLHQLYEKAQELPKIIKWFDDLEYRRDSLHDENKKLKSENQKLKALLKTALDNFNCECTNSKYQCTMCDDKEDIEKALGEMKTS